MDLEITISKPSNLLPEYLIESIAEIIRKKSEIAFAYISELHIPNFINEPSNTLVLITKKRGKKIEEITESIQKSLDEILPEGYILFLHTIALNNKLVKPVVETGYLIEVNDHDLYDNVQGL